MKKNIFMTVLVCVTAVCMIIGILWHVTGTIRPEKHSSRSAEVSFSTELPDENGKDEPEKADTPVEEDEKAEAPAKEGETAAEEGELTKLQITMHLGDLEILTGDKLDVSYSGDEKYEPDVQHNGSVITIEQPDVRGWKGISQLFKNGMLKAKLTVIIPKNTKLSSLTIREELGDIYLEKLDINQGSITDELGDITCKACELTNFTIDSELGDIDVDNCAFTSLSIKEELGDVDVNSAVDLSGESLELETELGEVSTNEESHGSKHSQSGSGEIRLAIHNDLGDIDVTW